MGVENHWLWRGGLPPSPGTFGELRRCVHVCVSGVLSPRCVGMCVCVCVCWYAFVSDDRVAEGGVALMQGNDHWVQ